MTNYISAAFAFAVCLALGACQTPQARQAELARICADPNNRAPGSFYWGECQAIDPSTPQELQRDYILGAPAGR